MADDEINPLGTPTTNYGWIKPTVGGDDDAWGGLLNTDLDGIDTTVKSVSTVANAAYPASNPAGYITAAAIPAPYVLPIASTTVLGGVKVDSSTIRAAGDGTISTTVVPMNDNRIINGDMRTDQRNAGAVTTPASPGYFTADRWRVSLSVGSKLNFQRVVNGSGMTANGWPYSLLVSTGAAYTPAAGEGFSLTQFIEAEMISDFGFGNSSVAQPITLSFWASCVGVTGTFGGAVKNTDNTRSYPFSFSLPVANTWTRIVVTIPGDTTGTWVLVGNGAGLAVTFDLGSGATLRAPANAWISGNCNGVTGAASIVATASAQLWITGVKLEIGSVATPFNRQSLAKSMADCQRYYQLIAPVIGGGAAITAGASVWSGYTMLCQMRAVPTLTLSSQTYSNGSALTASSLGVGAFAVTWTVTAAGTSWVSFNGALNAEL